MSEFLLGCATTGCVWALREYLRHRAGAKADRVWMAAVEAAQCSTWAPTWTNKDIKRVLGTEPKRNRKKRK